MKDTDICFLNDDLSHKGVEVLRPIFTELGIHVECLGEASDDTEFTYRFTGTRKALRKFFLGERQWEENMFNELIRAQDIGVLH
jgi:hypothetical protein